jgi:hypothetical protein
LGDTFVSSPARRFAVYCQEHLGEKAYAAATHAEVVPGLKATVLSFEDLLFLKRQANRPKDQQDVHYLLAIRGDKKDD